jgi:hypothetical protein
MAWRSRARTQSLSLNDPGTLISTLYGRSGRVTERRELAETGTAGLERQTGISDVRFPITVEVWQRPILSTPDLEAYQLSNVLE